MHPTTHIQQELKSAMIVLREMDVRLGELSRLMEECYRGMVVRGSQPCPCSLVKKDTDDLETGGDYEPIISP